MKYKYDNIINFERPVSRNHVPMPMENRAAQFAPFAALNGHESAVREAARVTEDRVILSDDRIAILNRKITFAVNNPDYNFKILYFKEDERKAGGKYIKVNSKIIKFNEYKKTIILENQEEISVEDIYEIESKLDEYLLK